MKRVLGVVVSLAMIMSSSPIGAAGPVIRSTSAAAAPGTIIGTVTGANGQTLPNVTVRVRNLQDGTLAGTTTSTASGRFSVAGLKAGHYVVEVASQSGPIVGSSPALDVPAGTTVAVNIASPARSPVNASAAQASGGGGVNKALVITSIAAAAGIVTIIAIASGDSSPSR